MAILAECPTCHKKQSTRNRACRCGENLIKAKRSQRVRYWVNFRLSDGTQRREAVGYIIEEARAAEGKRKAQKYENPRILERVPEERMTFEHLTDWYTELKAVKKLRTYDRVKQCLDNFNKAHGDRIVSTIRPMDLENYQEDRREAGRAPATIDMELTYARAVVSKAFDNDLVSGHTLKAFRSCERKLRRGTNTRKRTISVAEYLSLVEGAPKHLKPILVVAYNTGMRTGEIRRVQWSHIDREQGFIRLPAELTKERRPKTIPMNDHVRGALDSLPRALHHEFVFTFRGRPITDRGGLRNSFKAACKKAEIACGRKSTNGITFHDIRRSVKTNMMNAGIDKALRDTILGHSLQGMDAHYLAPSDEDVQRAMKKYTSWLNDQVDSIVASGEF